MNSGKAEVFSKGHSQKSAAEKSNFFPGF